MSEVNDIEDNVEVECAEESKAPTIPSSTRDFIKQKLANLLKYIIENLPKESKLYAPFVLMCSWEPEYIFANMMPQLLKYKRNPVEFIEFICQQNGDKIESYKVEHIERIVQYLNLFIDITCAKN